MILSRTKQSLGVTVARGDIMGDGHKPLLLTVREVSILLRVHRPKVYELIQNGTLAGFKIGSDWRVKLESVEALLGPIPESFFQELNEEPREA